MKKKTVVLGLLICIISISVFLIDNYENKRYKENKKEEENISYNTELALILLEGYGDEEVETTLDVFPDSSTHYLDFAKSNCANGSIIGWDNENNKVKITATKADKCKLYFRAGTASTLDSAILVADTPSTTTPDFSTVTSDGEYGLYSAEDDLGTSYYFRGDVENNYVKFGAYPEETTLTVIDYDNWSTKDITIAKNTPMYWRIVRINGDGTVRLIYAGTEKVANGESGTAIVDQTRFGTQYGIYESSSLKTSLDTWYSNNLKSNYEKYIADGIFCNDREVSDFTGSYSYYYEPYVRIVENKTPQLTCKRADDKYTVSSIGNELLTNPVGTITVDEVAMAGGVVSKSNTSYYLYSGDNYWTMSSTFYENDTYGDHAFYATKSSSITYYVIGSNGVASDFVGARPVINIRADVLFTGTGEIDTPYVIAGFEE